MTIFVRMENDSPDPITRVETRAVKSNYLSYVIGCIALFYLASYSDLSFFKDSILFEVKGFWKYVLLSLAYFIAVPAHFCLRDIDDHFKWSLRILLSISLLYMAYIIVISAFFFFLVEDWISAAYGFSVLGFWFALYAAWCCEINARKTLEEPDYYVTSYEDPWDAREWVGDWSLVATLISNIVSPPLLLGCVFWIYRKIHLHYDLVHNMTDTHSVDYRWQVLYLIIYGLLIGFLIFCRFVYDIKAREFIRKYNSLDI